MKCDLLYDQIAFDLSRSGKLKDMDAAQQKQRIEEESDKYFNENCVKPLEKIAHRPKRLKWVRVSSMAFHLLVHAFC
jgi:hypothetical protein